MSESGAGKKRKKSSSNRCTACGEGVAHSELRPHPILYVPICGECWDVYHSGSFDTGDNGNEIYCRWCGDGGEIIQCDTCIRSFCANCIRRNFGLPELQRILDLDGGWNCFVCVSAPLDELCVSNGWTITRAPGGNKPVREKRRLKHTGKVVCADVSAGREQFPIPCVNDVDEQLPPLAFTYVTEPALGDCVKVHRNPSLYTCCSCTDNCRDPNRCECARAMEGFAYNDHKQLQEPKTCIYECNLFCSCHKARCSNRVVGQGLALPLEVFRCPDKGKGWGVRCLESIPAGTYVTDYIGEILTESKAEERGMKKGDEYLFTLDMWTKQKALLDVERLGISTPQSAMPAATQVHWRMLSHEQLSDCVGADIAELVQRRAPMDWSSIMKRKLVSKEMKIREDFSATSSPRQRLRRQSDADVTTLSLPDTEDGAIDMTIVHRIAAEELMDRAELKVENQQYCVDAKWFGNVGRFINHSCDPNLAKQTVLVETQDFRMPRLAFFAMEDIEPLVELTYDYGYSAGTVEGKNMLCLCGAESCRGQMY